jgi:hypothetical protein
MDASGLRERSDRIERLLEEVRELASPPAWERVDSLVATIVDLYGTGLARVLALIAEAGRLDENLAARLAGDELVAGLLTLHGLHPHGAAERIRRALAPLAADVGAIELVAVEESVARLRFTGGGSARIAPARLARAVERLVRDVAPEVARVEIEGLSLVPSAVEGRSPVENLVQIDLGRSRRGARP